MQEETKYISFRRSTFFDEGMH